MLCGTKVVICGLCPVAGITCLNTTICSDGAWHNNVVVHDSGMKVPASQTRYFSDHEAPLDIVIMNLFCAFLP